MPELGPYGSVRGALSNERPYRDLRNVAINYPLVRAHRFAGIQPNSGRRDYSRLSCGVGDTQLGPNMNPTFLAAVKSHGGPGAVIHPASGTVPAYVNPPDRKGERLAPGAADGFRQMLL